MVTAMICDRCGGFQRWSHFENLGGASGSWAYDGWLCINCGDIVDPLIVNNRKMQNVVDHRHLVRPFENKAIWLRAGEKTVAGSST